MTKLEELVQNYTSNVVNRKRMERLTGRKQYLEKRIDDGAKIGKNWAYDKAELSALNWAIEALEALTKYTEEHPHD